MSRATPHLVGLSMKTLLLVRQDDDNAIIRGERSSEIVTLETVTRTARNIKFIHHHIRAH